MLCFIKTIDAEIEQPPTNYFHFTVEFFRYTGQNRRRRIVRKRTTRSIDWNYKTESLRAITGANGEVDEQRRAIIRIAGTKSDRDGGKGE